MSKYTILNPYDNSFIGEFDYCDKKIIESNLKTLFTARTMTKNIPAFKKAQILEKLSQLVEKNKVEIATLITKEVGKPIKESLAEVTRAASVALCASHESRRIEGEILDCDAYSDMQGKQCHVTWAPLGVILAITPFNFPFNLAMHKIAPAFAAGNTIFFKPGPQNYLSSKLLVELCYQAGMPQESLILSCPEIADMEDIIKDKRISCVNFTGGLLAAKIIARHAGFKKMIMELGGNDPLIVMDDADLDLAVTTAIAQRFGTAGQKCNACKKLFIHKKVYDAFKELLISKTKELAIGDPSKESTDLGPLINTKAADEVESRIQSALKAGAKLIYGNERDGNILAPTILENVRSDMELVAEETFGPVIPLFKFSAIDEVIDEVNRSPYSLQSGVMTNNLNIIKKLQNALEVGSINVNAGPGFRADHMPFGGVKESGIGKEGLRYAIREMSYQKNLIF
jgi:acyl-CoA reductase-like NAD-dependent aldehyde dehydrogenase